MHGYRWWCLGVCALSVVACARDAAGGRRGESTAGERRGGAVRPGIAVLLDDSVHLIRGKRIGLLTNQTGTDERGESDVDLPTRDPRATRAGVHVMA
jgi:uncharacterized protein YbbC (DUF1343 family)